MDPIEETDVIESDDTLDYSGLSDEEFAKLPFPNEVDDLKVKEEKEVTPLPGDELLKEIDGTLEEGVTEPLEQEEEEEDGTSPDDVKPPEIDEKPAEEGVETPSDSIAKIDFEAEYKKMMAPFKANGVKITPKSPEDALRFMQMGANYHKKMAGMKPALKALKTLEKNGLLDDTKLDFLIDLHNGNPEAITRLLKDKEINPLDVDIEAESEYTPANHSVTDAEMELDSVLETIRESPNFTKTLNVVTKEWDNDSRAEAANNPQIISVINGHIDNGVYDKVMSAVDYDRSVGKLTNISDLEAYKLTGNRLEQEGSLAPTVTSPNTVKNEVPIPKPDQRKEAARRAQKKAAGPTKTSPRVGKLPADFNPLDLSDEDFEKFDPKRLGI